MKRLITITVLSGVLTAACAPAPEPAPMVDTAEALADLRATDAAYHAAVNGLDAAAWVSFYTSDARVYPPNAPELTTTADIQAFAEEMFAIEGFSVNVATSVVEVGAGGDVGYSIGYAELTMPGPDGSPVSDSGPDVHVWRMQADGSWKLAIDIWNSDVPLPEADSGGN